MYVISLSDLPLASTLVKQSVTLNHRRKEHANIKHNSKSARRIDVFTMYQLNGKSYCPPKRIGLVAYFITIKQPTLTL